MIGLLFPAGVLAVAKYNLFAFRFVDGFEELHGYSRVLEFNTNFS
jgi:hypothetical protein